MSIHTSEYTTYRDGEQVTVPAKVTFVGLTLCEREENYYDDSDGYSHVYDPNLDKVVRVGTWTTRAQSMTAPGKVDAYDEDSPYYEDMRQAHIRQLMDIWYLDQKHQYTSDKTNASNVTKGEYVVVVKGRKVAKGTEGVVFWTKPDEYSYNYYTKDYDKQRIGIRDAEGEAHWTTDNNVVVLDPDLPDPADYIGEEVRAEMLAKLEGLTLKQLHGTLCQYSSRLAYVR